MLSNFTPGAFRPCLAMQAGQSDPITPSDKDIAVRCFDYQTNSFFLF